MSQPVSPTVQATPGTPIADLLKTGDSTVDVTVGDFKMDFLWKTSGQEQKWSIVLGFVGFAVAMHPPSNVIAISEKTNPDSYVTPW